MSRKQPIVFSRFFVIPLALALLTLGCEKGFNLQEDISLKLKRTELSAEKIAGITIFESVLEPEHPSLAKLRGTRVLLRFPGGSEPLVEKNLKVRIGLDTVGTESRVSVSLIGESRFKIRAFARDIEQNTITIQFSWNDDHPELAKLKYYDSPSRAKFDWKEVSTGIGSLHIDRKHFFGLLSERLTACTAFAVAPQVVMTNHHCISDANECQNAAVRFWIKDDDDRRLNIDRPCQKILQTDAERDFTLLLLDKPLPASFKPLSLVRDRRGLRENTPLEVISMNPPETKRSRTCVTEYRLLGVDMTIDALIRTRLSGEIVRSLYSVKLKPCDIKKGDSGSPILNFDGYVVGLLHSINTDTTLVSKISGEFMPSALFIPMNEIVRIAAPVLDQYSIDYAR